MKVKMTGRTPKDFNIGSIELQPIGAHPRQHFIDGDRQPKGKVINVIRPTESIKLDVISMRVLAEL